MNAVEIEEAVSELVLQPFDAAEFPFQFITAFGAKKATVDRLRKGDTNQSDVGGVLQRNNIHIGIAPAGEVTETLARLRASPKTASAKAKFLIATDGETVEAEDLIGGDVIACAYADLPRHFAMFLPLAGISTVKEIKNNPIDVKATGRLNKLYVELLKDNPDWATEGRRHELNQFMARLIFCFFAEDTGIFREHQFTETITQMSHAGHGSGEEQWGNTHEVLTELFRAMDTPVTHEGNLDPRYREAASIRPYADVFPYVNGGLFTGAVDAPRFSRTARAYLLRAGELDWKEINPDIFGSMIQAVAEDDERGELGMHYTSVPNILKVLNPLFLDDLREQLEAAGDSKQKLRNLRKRLGNIRVFDPACGSGNFLVIAYKEMRAIEAQIVERLGGEANLKLAERRSVIPLSNFYGIEIKGFAAEIARLALLIAEFQADCLYLSQQEARAMVLPLHKTGQITVGNALRSDWLKVCPSVAAQVIPELDLAGPTGGRAIEETGLNHDADVQTYLCGNPPYLGAKKKSPEQKEDMDIVGVPQSVDYVVAFLAKAAEYGRQTRTDVALVSTSSICQGEQVASVWKPLLSDYEINFAYTPFKWSNSAANNAGVYCTIVGLSREPSRVRRLISSDAEKGCSSISPYLIEGEPIICEPRKDQISRLQPMVMGSNPVDGRRLVMDLEDGVHFVAENPNAAPFVRDYFGTQELTNGLKRLCLWIEEDCKDEALSIAAIASKVEDCRIYRLSAGRDAKRSANRPYAFCYSTFQNREHLIVGKVIGEKFGYVPFDFHRAGSITSVDALTVYGQAMVEAAIIASTLHRVWAEAVSGRMGNGIRYGNTVVYNTFPVPKLTEQEKADLAHTAENILLAREAHFPATIADLYDPKAMPDDLRRAHEDNDEVLERIYIGRRFRNDTERLEKLFDLYTKMTANTAPKGKGAKKGKAA
ncbi:class I SAM-dependent DNA methyltransferase [Sphingopyxis sp. GC21]|uniref:class I SAM-dependent DNA methyltransferase n=1 Tax=Sphingopyxis sp. GC21 TaxID=2933562 RepID=UPI0021E3E8A8|nr:DNA methyltransferase [Sphingopyxis sp. GC21]